MLSGLKAYNERLCEDLCSCLSAPISLGNIKIVKSLMDQICLVEKFSEKWCLTSDEAKVWAEGMINEDGTIGPHWTVAETSIIEHSEIDDTCWWLTMNMMYSDYCKVATKFNVTAEALCTSLSKAFLEDKDAECGETKLARYYYGIVKK